MSTLTIGTMGPSADGFPFTVFHDGFPLPRTYQQFYRAGAFPGPMTIRSLSFASALVTPPAGATVDVNTTGTTTLTVSLSTTASTAWPPTVSTAPSNNRGADFTGVYSGTVTINPTSEGAPDLAITLATPFSYHPASGNLLLEVTITAGAVVFASWHADATGANMVRLFDCRDLFPVASQYLRDNTGLVTTFGY